MGVVMNKDFVINRINNVIASCVNIEQLGMAKNYSNRLVDTYNLNNKGGVKMKKPGIKNMFFMESVEIVKGKEKANAHDDMSKVYENCGKALKNNKLTKQF